MVIFIWKTEVPFLVLYNLNKAKITYHETAYLKAGAKSLITRGTKISHHKELLVEELLDFPKIN